MNEARFRQAEERMWASVGVSPTERRLPLSRTGVDVRVQEVGEGPPVVFVHGASNSGVSWAQLVSRLEGFRCIVLDRPGCGLSEPVIGPFDDVGRLAAFADALIIDVLDGLELPQAAVVATSFGGYIALRSAAAHPDRIQRVFALGWPVGAPIVRTPWLMRMATVPGVGKFTARVPVNARVVRTMFRQIGLRQALEAGKVSPEMLDCTIALLRHTPTMRNELAAGPRIITPLKGMNDSILLPAGLLASIATPVYFLWGDDDPMGGPDVARAFVAQLPNAELELMPGGHAVWIDDPDRVAKTAGAFLSG